VAAPSPVEEDLSALGRRISEDAVRLVRLEIELAKEQAVESAKRFLWAGIWLGLAATCAVLGVIYALGAVPEAIGPPIHDYWTGWLVFGFFLLLVAAAFGYAGFRRVMATVRTTREAVSSIKEDIEWVKELPKRSVERSS
jgi:Putative Actinobacterial Holin-X, holin superfamily III